MPQELEPSHAQIMDRLARVEERFTVAIEGLTKELQAHSQDRDRIHRFLYGDHAGPGLAELVRQHERWIGTQRRLFMVLTPAVFLGVAAVVWQAVMLALQNHAS